MWCGCDELQLPANKCSTINQSAKAVQPNQGSTNQPTNQLTKWPTGLDSLHSGPFHILWTLIRFSVNFQYVSVSVCESESESVYVCLWGKQWPHHIKSHHITSQHIRAHQSTEQGGGAAHWITWHYILLYNTTLYRTTNIIAS